MTKNWRLMLFLVLLVAPGIKAQANYFEINAVGALNASAPSELKNGTSQGWTGNTTSGMGLLVATNLGSSPFDLETGAIYLNETSARIDSGNKVNRITLRLQIPLLIRYHFDERMALGIGGYAGIGQGSVITETNGTGVLNSYSDAGIKLQDYGLLLSARASLKILEQWYFIIDGRYQHGLSNLSQIPPGTAGDYINSRAFQANLGISYRFAM
jgi:hypothetical protein